MATVTRANLNNFFRFWKVDGTLTLAGLQALAGTTLDSGENETMEGNDMLPLAITEASEAPTGEGDYNSDYNSDFNIL